MTARRGPMLRALAACRSGANAVEFALLTPVLFGLVGAGLDFGRAFSEKLQLEQAASRAMELASGPGAVNSSYAHLAPDATAAYGKPVTRSVGDNWLECNGVRQASFTGICPAGQQTARYVSVVISANYTPLLGWGSLFNNGKAGGPLTVTGDAVVRIQ